jgi:hypothetical protein
MRAYVLGLGCFTGLSVGCDSPVEVTHQPSSSVSVRPLPVDGEIDYGLDLRVVLPTGERLMDLSGLRASRFGDGEGTVTYVGVCEPGENRVGIGIHGVEVLRGEAPEGLVEPAMVSVAVTCEEDRDVRLDYAFELATMTKEDAGATALAFSDIRCETRRTCSDGGVGFEVACARVTDAGGVTLGVSGARVVCGGLELPVQPVGQSDALDAQFNGTAEVQGGSSRWAMEVAAAGLSGCRFEASLIAAPELVGGFGPPCRGWPVLDVELPLSASACEATHAVEVDYRDGGGFASELVIDERGAYAPTPAVGWLPACRAAADVWGDMWEDEGASAQPVVVTDRSQGFIDFAVTVSLP